MRVLTRIYGGRLLLALVALVPVAAVVGDALAVDPGGVSNAAPDQTASTTAAEKMAFATSAVQEITDAEKAVSKWLDQAKAKGDADADMLACVNNRLTSIRAILTVATAAKTSLGSALTDGNEEAANHEYRKLAVAVSKTRVLLAEAQQCVSGNQLESGTTIVDWQTELTEEADADDFDIDDLDIGPNPPQITPFM